MMTKGEAAERVLGTTTTFDCSLPQPWLDQWANVLKGRFTYHEILGSFVWAYDEPYRLCGRPCPITRLGNEILAAINCHGDTRYPLTEHPADEEVKDRPVDLPTRRIKQPDDRPIDHVDVPRNIITHLAVKAYMGMSCYYATDDGEPNDLALGIAYLLADLHHLVDEKGYGWEDMLSWAGEHYHEETEENS